MEFKVFYICKFHEYCDTLRKNNECHHTSCSKARKHIDLASINFKRDELGNFWEIEEPEDEISVADNY